MKTPGNDKIGDVWEKAQVGQWKTQYGVTEIEDELHFFTGWNNVADEDAGDDKELAYYEGEPESEDDEKPTHKTASLTFQGDYDWTYNCYLGVIPEGTTRGAYNQQVGLYLNGATNGFHYNLVIGGNIEAGVKIEGATAIGNWVYDSMIGVLSDGTTPVGNACGVAIVGGASSNVIGVDDGGGVGNVISGNTSHGVLISGSGTMENVVAGNIIGTNALGAENLGNASANVIKSLSAGSQAFTKTEYDGLGRAAVVYVGYDLSEVTTDLFDVYGDVDLDLSDDAIFEQYETTYDTAGHLIGQVTAQRLHDATGTGKLSDGSQPKARLSYNYYWFDGLGRQTAAANYGVVAGTPPSRTDTPPASSSSTVLVTTTEYNDRGEVAATFDTAGRESRVYYDDAGRVITTIENYVDGDPETGDACADVTTETTYTADGQVATYTAVNPDTGDQVTQYVYGTTLTESGVARSDLLRSIIYPDSDDTFSMTGAAPTLYDGVDTDYDRVETTYNRAGRAVSTKDQNETGHDCLFDALGRLTDDCVTAIDASLDDTVLRISRTYEVRGMLESATSWDDADPGEGDEVNQIVYEYDDFGQLTREYQEHVGAVDDTPYVEYHYADGSDNHVRLEAVEYPNGRLVHYTYGATDTAADALSRLDAIHDDDSGSPGDVLAAYTYLGLGTIVIEDYADPQVQLDYYGGTPGTYAGLDRFGRVVEQWWFQYDDPQDRYDDPTDLDQYAYAYDLAGNRLYRENVLTSGMDELYDYDTMNQLVNFQRGDLDGWYTAMTGTIANEETFTLDATGNWAGYVQEVAGSTVLDQTRTANEANEIETITADPGTNWVDPKYDAAGNMTAGPNASNPIQRQFYVYDAWNRLVAAYEDTDNDETFEPAGDDTLLASYTYDSQNRRITRAVPTGYEDVSITTDYYHNANWQVVEERQNEHQPVFSGDGIVVENLDGNNTFGNAVIVDAEGRTLVAGYAYIDGVNGYDFAVARYLADGSLDTSFGDDDEGIATVNIGIADMATAIAIDDDGRIFVAGIAYSGATHFDFALACLDEDGDLDTTFDWLDDEDGIVVTPVTSGNDRVTGIVIDSDGRVILGGYADMGATGDDLVLACYDPDTGRLDNSFGTGGIASTPVGVSDGADQARDIAIDANDRVFLVTTAWMGGGISYDYGVACYDTVADEWDDDFGTNGVVTFDVGSTADHAYAVAVDSQGRVLVGGDSYQAGGYVFTLARLDVYGDLDTTFGTGGIVTTTIGDSGIRTDCAKSVAIDARGRIVVGGSADMSGTGKDMVVLRYLDDGTLDPSFGGGDGIVIQDVGGTDVADSIAFGPGGCIFAAGDATIDSDNNIALIRYNPDGTLTTSTTQYVHSPRYIDAVICRDVADGATLVEGSRLYYTSDANHNVTALLSADGDMVERYVYTPYGQAEIYAGNWSETYETSTFDNTHLYTGRVHDGAIDLIYFRARWYHAGVGGFTSRDPMGYDAGANLYSYVGNRPILFVDPLGLAEITVSIGFVNDEEWKLSAIASRWEGAGADKSIEINADSPDWTSALEDLYNAVPPGDCIKDLTMVGHGYNFGTGRLIDPASTNPEVIQFLNAIESKMCGVEGTVDIKACKAADGNQQYICDLAQFLDADVKGVDDWYAIWPYGTEYTAHPDGSVDVTGHNRPYKGSWVHYFWSGGKDEKKESVKSLKEHIECENRGYPIMSHPNAI